MAMHPVHAAEAPSAELQLYLASGGSLDDLCVVDENAHQHADCPLCRELEIFVLPDPAACGAATVLSCAPTVVFTTPRLVAAVPQARPPARAPPRI